VFFPRPLFFPCVVYLFTLPSLPLRFVFFLSSLCSFFSLCSAFPLSLFVLVSRVCRSFPPSRPCRDVPFFVVIGRVSCLSFLFVSERFLYNRDLFLSLSPLLFPAAIALLMSLSFSLCRSQRTGVLVYLPGPSSLPPLCFVCQKPTPGFFTTTPLFFPQFHPRDVSGVLSPFRDSSPYRR